MSNRPPISWNNALRSLRDDRVRVAPGVLSARALIQGIAKVRRTAFVTPTGAYDRAAVMAAAVMAARAHQERTGAAWGASMSVGLTAAWQAARIARSATAH